MLWIWTSSLRTVHRFAEMLGWIAFSIIRIRRQVVMENLRRAFPEASQEELENIALRAYQNFAKMMFEYSRFPILKKKEVLSSCELKGEEHLQWALKNGKGAVLVGGHFGNWELMGAYLAQRGYPIAFLVGQQKNQWVDDLMNRHRECMGIQIIPMGIAMRRVIRTLWNNGWVAMLADQDAGKDGIFVNFFHTQVSNHQGPAVFALRTRAPILFGSAIRLANGRHRFEFELIRTDSLQGGATPENIHFLTQAYTSLLEKAIRKYPDHWFWMHRRWKTRPPEEKVSSAPAATPE